MKKLSIVLCALAFVFEVAGTARTATKKESSDLLQFTAAGHVLGFESKAVYVVSGDHMLRVEFAGTSGVTPVADRMPSENGQVQPLGQITYPDLWPGISLIYDQVAGDIVESTYLLEPGADVGQIQLRYNAPVELEAGGSLRIDYATGQMRESAPVAWQDIDGRRIPVEVSFCLPESPVRKPVVSFAVGQHDPAYPLMIDPTLEWNTFMGSGNYDESRAVAVDGSGNVYVTGFSILTWGSPVTAHAGADDAFVAKLNSSGALQWNTFMGAAGDDWGSGIAVDGNGNVYVTGGSSATWGSPITAHAGGFEAFAAKLNSSGALQWNTFMGSASPDSGDAIAVDKSGDVYVAGISHATWGTPVNAQAGLSDAFAVKLNSSGALQWNTFMGAAGNDYGYGIAVDGSGNVYVAGYSWATWGSPVTAYAGGDEAFAAKLNSSGALQWNTFMGSSGDDWGYGIAVDGSGDVYVAGGSSATWGSPVTAYAGDDDAFAVKLNSSGALQWNTFMGSASDDSGDAIAVDKSGDVYVAGGSSATWGSPVTAYAGSSDAFAVELNSSGALQWNTFMGSASYDGGEGIAVDESGNVYVAGSSSATWGSPVTAYAASSDAFAAKLVPTTAVPTTSEWGMIIFFILLVGSGLWVMSRRRIHRAG